MNRRPVTRELAHYIEDLKYADLPPETIRAAKEAVLDQIGIMLMGSTLPWTRPAYEVACESGGRPESRIVGHGERICALDAAFVNATSAIRVSSTTRPTEARKGIPARSRSPPLLRSPSAPLWVARTSCWP